MRQRAIVIFCITLTLGALAARPAAAATHDDGAEQRSFHLVNQERAERGLPRLVWDDRMAQIARDHSRDMANDGELRHNDRLPSQVGDYQALGENVGYGADADHVHAAFMDSDSHRKIIVGDRYTRLGVGAIRDGELVWITQVFYTPRSSQPSPEPSSSSSPAPKKKARPAPEREVTRTSDERVRAQSFTTVQPIRTPKRAQRRLTTVPRPRTLAMLDAVMGIDQELTMRPAIRPLRRA